MKIQKGIILAFISILFISAKAQHTIQSAPKLVVGITIEHLRADYLKRYYSSFTNDGFKRLMDNGAYFENATANIHNIKAPTMLTSIYSGVTPAIHGIIGDKWYSPVNNNLIDAFADDYYLTMGSDSDFGNISAKNIKVFTLPDVLKQQSNGKSKVYSVALNAHSAVSTAGHSANGAFWFDIANGNMISSSYYCKDYPEWIIDFNSKKLAQTYLQRQWNLLLPTNGYTASLNDDHVLESGFWKKWNTFPYDLSRISRDQEYPLEIIKASYFGNSIVRDFAVHLISNEKLGADSFPDMLNITFSSLDYANKWYHPSSLEMEEIYLRTDREIASLLKYLDQTIGKSNYLIFLTSASTSVYPVNMLKDEYNFDAGEFSPQSAMALLRLYLNALYGADEWIVGYNEEQIYLNRKLIEKKSESLSQMQEKAALFLNQLSGIRAAVPAYVIETGNLNTPRFEILENTYSQQRSGDIMLILNDGWYPVHKYKQVDYSNHTQVPVIFYGQGIKPAKHYSETSVFNIVPTLCKSLQILPPVNTHGKILDEIFW